MNAPETDRVLRSGTLDADDTIYRTLAENSPDAIVRYDRECRHAYVNPGFERTAGLRARDVLGRTPAETNCVFPMEGPACDAWLRGIMEDGLARAVELDRQRTDGARMVQHVVGVPERDETGRVVGVLAIGRDVSALKEIEWRLEQAEAMAHLGYWEWSFAEKAGSLSAEARRILGKPEEWAFRLPEVLAMTAEEDRGWLPVAFNAAIASCAPRADFDFRILVDERLIDLHSTIRIEYSPESAPLRIVGTVQDVTELKGYRDKLHSLAFYDTLTAMPNREQFNARVRDAITRAGRKDEVAVMILDLDNFKTVNDTLGHGAGDEVLRETALRLRRCVREYDMVARLGGDEFGFVLSDVGCDADIGKICRKLLDVFGEAYRVDDDEIFLTGSIGVARYPADGRDISDLLQYADAAMYHAKAMGRNNYQFYAASLTRDVAERLTLAARLRKAEINGELELYYQPQIDLCNGQIVGAEALLRWNHPQEGLLPPDRFIGIAEETGLIVSIGEWVMRSACAAATAWNRDRRNPLKIAINLSPRQFRSDNLIGALTRAMGETGCSSSWIELEITESLLLDDTVDVGRTLHALKNLGFSIALDDFGTGYSALGYLTRFPVESIKIDRSFVRDMATRRNSAELVKAIISMAKSLTLGLVAEGIEDRFQEEFLRAHGCQRGQGYLFAKPMRYPEFEVFHQTGCSASPRTPGLD